MIRIHKEGRIILTVIFLFLVLINTGIILVFKLSFPAILSRIIISLLLMIFFLRFFRIPSRKHVFDEKLIFSPADGKVVVIEETLEEEYFRDRRMQVSIFMSVWDVHINFFPVSGKIKYYKYHPGDYLIARHPKSSTLNERNTIVIETSSGKEILVRQIAGFVARKISCYCKEGDQVKQLDQLGFIKFGSRVDIFLPLGTEVTAILGQHVSAQTDVIAKF
jgi:phosphatidylserine decarboxylase